MKMDKTYLNIYELTNNSSISFDKIVNLPGEGKACEKSDCPCHDGEREADEEHRAQVNYH